MDHYFFLTASNAFVMALLLASFGYTLGLLLESVSVGLRVVDFLLEMGLSVGGGPETAGFLLFIKKLDYYSSCSFEDLDHFCSPPTGNASLSDRTTKGWSYWHDPKHGSISKI